MWYKILNKELENSTEIETKLATWIVKLKSEMKRNKGKINKIKIKIR